MKLIDKDALVAEIKEKIMQYEVAFNDPSFASCEACLIAKGKYRKLLDILQYINTLEVKEENLEKEFESFLDNIEGVPRMWHSDEQIEWAKDIAKHFFELGLKAQKGE